MPEIPPVTLTRYATDEDGAELHDFASVEVNEGQVDLIVSPYTMDALTYSFTPSQAWALARELAKGATHAEDDED